MMLKLTAAATSNVTWMTTAYVNNLHSTDGNGFLN